MRVVVLAALVGLLAACGGGGGGGSAGGSGSTGDGGGGGSAATYQVGVDVTGNAVGGLVLENNGGDRLAIDRDGHFVFPSGIVAGAQYSVRVAQQPVAQVCRVVNAQGSSATNAVVVTAQCVNRIVAALQTTLRTNVGANGEFEQFLYVRSPRTDLHQFRIRSSDGGIDEVASVWRVTPYAQTFVFSANGARAFADDGVGDVSAANVRDSDGALVPTWTSLFGNYVPVLPILLNTVRPSADGVMLYRNFTAVVGGIRYWDLWVGAVSDTGISTLAGSPFQIGSIGAGPNFDPSNRYFARESPLTGTIDIYPAFTSATQTPVMLSQFPTTFPANTSTVVWTEPSPGTYFYEGTSVFESGLTTGQSPKIAIHSWQPNGTLVALGGVLSGQTLTGEIVAQLCLTGGTSTSRSSLLMPFPPTTGSARFLVQRQDTSCTGFGGTGYADSRVLGVYYLTVANGQAALARVPLDALPGWADLGSGGTQHPTKPWLYIGSKHAQRVYGYTVDALTGAVQPLSGSPFDGKTVPAQSSSPSIPDVVVDPTGKYLYMTRYAFDSTGATNVDAFTIDQATGVLTAVATYPL